MFGVATAPAAATPRCPKLIVGGLAALAVVAEVTAGMSRPQERTTAMTASNHRDLIMEPPKFRP
jgi:hypothetical protein